MVTHASNELIGALAGVAPYPDRDTFLIYEKTECALACGAPATKKHDSYTQDIVPVMACQGYAMANVIGTGSPYGDRPTDHGDGDDSQFSEIDCPDCLVLMDAAREGRVVR